MFVPPVVVEAAMVAEMEEAEEKAAALAEDAATAEDLGKFLFLLKFSVHWHELL